MPRKQGRKADTRRTPMVAIRVDRLRAAQRLDGRAWPDIARALGTTHPRLFHLTHGEGPVQRRCRQSLRDGFADLFQLDRQWLAGETDTLRYVITADAAVVNLDPVGHQHVEARWSMLDGTPPPSPAIQLALDRLLAQADAALRRDLAPLAQDTENGWSHNQLREFALLLVAQSVETGIELVRPLPPIENAEALRLSAILHTALILQPWVEDSGAYPDWKRLYDQIVARVPQKDGRAGLMLFMAFEKMDEGLFALYSKIRKD